jgi:hypothetical protein
MPSTTMKAVRQRALSKVLPLLGARLDPVRTATAGGAASVTDSSAALPSATTNHFDNWFIKIATAAGASEGDVRAVSAGGFTIATGAFTAASNFSASPAAADIFEISPFDPAISDRIIKELVRELYMPTLFPLSLSIFASDNNDGEASTIADGYSVAVGGAALSAETTIVFNGSQSIKSTDNAGNEYFALASQINMPEGKSLYAGALCSVTQGDDAIFRVWDVTNNAAISPEAATDEPAWMSLIIPFTVPSGCEQIDLRMVTVASGDIAYWEDIQVWENGRGVYPLPSWITRKEQVKDVVAFPRGTAGPGTNDYRTDEHMSYGLNWHFEREDITAASELHLVVDNPGESRPYIVATRALPEPTSDTSAINFEPELLAFGAAARMLQMVPDRTDEQSRQMLVYENAWKGGLRGLGMGVNLDAGRSERVWA